MADPLEHISKMDQEINWMNLDGHLDNDEVAKSISDLQLQLHETRKVFEKLNKNKENKSCGKQF